MNVGQPWAQWSILLDLAPRSLHYCVQSAGQPGRAAWVRISRCWIGDPLDRGTDSRGEAKLVVVKDFRFRKESELRPNGGRGNESFESRRAFPNSHSCPLSRTLRPGMDRREDGNISRSGVLFRTESVLSPKTAVEVRLALPVVIEDEAPCEILCKGVVVRVEQSSIRGAPPALAVAIQHYRLSRGRQVN